MTVKKVEHKTLEDFIAALEGKRHSVIYMNVYGESEGVMAAKATAVIVSEKVIHSLVIREVSKDKLSDNPFGWIAASSIANRLREKVIFMLEAQGKLVLRDEKNKEWTEEIFKGIGV